jgi:hypothetical protein
VLENIPACHTEIARFSPNCFQRRTSKFPNKKGTFDINLAFTATLIFLYKKGTFHQKKRHLWSFENWGGARAPCAPAEVFAKTIIMSGVGLRETSQAINCKNHLADFENHECARARTIN